MKLATSGALVIDRPGTVVAGRDFTGCIDIRASNVTIRYDRIRSRGRCGGGYQISTGVGLTGIVIEDTEIDGLGFADGAGICCGGFTALRVNIHDVGGAGVHAADNVTVQDSWVHDLVVANGSHDDDILTNGPSSNLSVHHNRLENAHTQTSVIALFEDFGPITNATIDNNLLNGGGYTVYAGGDAPAGRPCINCRFTNNRFLRTPDRRAFWPNGGYWGRVTALDGTIVWTGNVWDDTGQPT